MASLIGSIAGKLSLGLIAVLGLGLLASSCTAEKWHSRYQSERAWGDGVFSAAKAAGDNPKLDRAETADQIAAMGRGLTRLKEGLATCTASALAAEAADKARQTALDATLAQAAGTRSAMQGTIDRLLRSAANPGDGCQPSAALKEVWK